MARPARRSATDPSASRSIARRYRRSSRRRSRTSPVICWAPTCRRPRRSSPPMSTGFARRIDALARDRLRDFLFKKGRPRADIDYEARVLGPHSVEAHFRLHTIDERRVGKIVVRGNFHTKTWVIEDRLDLHEGQLLTSDALAE